MIHDTITHRTVWESTKMRCQVFFCFVLCCFFYLEPGANNPKSPKKFIYLFIFCFFARYQVQKICTSKVKRVRRETLYGSFGKNTKTIKMLCTQRTMTHLGPRIKGREPCANSAFSVKVNQICGPKQLFWGTNAWKSLSETHLKLRPWD